MLAKLKEMFVAGPSEAGSRRQPGEPSTPVHDPGRYILPGVHVAGLQGPRQRDGPDGLPEGPDPRQERGGRGPGLARGSRPAEGEIAIAGRPPPRGPDLRVRRLRPRASTSSSWSSSTASASSTSASRRSADLRQKLELLAQAAEGLAAVHAAGFIHHDIGPQNFLVDRDHQVKLIDFGLAVPNTPAFRGPGNRTGHAPVHGPRADPPRADRRADRHLLASASLAFEFLTDRLPYDAAANSMAMMLQRINTSRSTPPRSIPSSPTSSATSSAS